MKNTLFPLFDITKAISERRRQVLHRTESWRSLGSILFVVFFMMVAIILFNLFFGFRIIIGSDMFPSLCDGDLALCYKSHDFKKDDIVFYKADDENHCGRVIAKSGDYVYISDSGTVFVNDTIQENEIVYPTYPRDGEFSTIVPEGEVFVLGDFRTQAKDSRDYGCISLDNIEKKVIVIIRHRKF